MNGIHKYSLDKETEAQGFLKTIPDWIINNCGFWIIIG